MASTIYDIAKKAGVSIATVSRVFNQSDKVTPATRDKILAIADEVGYHPHVFAQGLAGKKNNVITAVVPVISNYFFMEVLSGIQDKLSDLNYELNIYNISPNKNTAEQVEQVVKKRLAAGYMFISVHLSENEWAELKKYKVPVILVDEYYDGFDSVSVDNAQGAYHAVKNLLQAGYKRVAMISALETSKPIRDRLRGYKKALSELGIEYNPQLVVKGDDMNRDGFTEKAGYQAMMKVLKQNPVPDACICASDIQAVGALKAMQDRNISIPIIGYDDIELAEYIGLSTIRQPMRDMGYFATQNLLERINNPKKAVSQTIYTPELVKRASTNTNGRAKHE